MTQLIWYGFTTLMGVASAQDFDDLDSDEKKSRKNREVTFDSNVREIYRGFYSKSGAGAGLYIGSFSGALKPGATINLSFGQDFIDRETMSAAWEVSYVQGIHNGAYYEEQAALGGPFVQGDTRTSSFIAVGEYSYYPSRRIGIGVRAGAGVMLAPLLMDEAYYIDEVVGKAWGGINPGYHSSPHPMVLGGPAFEYYSKLAHFSVGLDADIFYAIGFDLGANAIGYMKYTF